MDQVKFSLSTYFDELKRREQKPHTPHTPEILTTTLSLIKALKNADDHTLTLAALARAAGLKIGPCQEITDQLCNEGILDTEPDPETGNDRIKLTQKGLKYL